MQRVGLTLLVLAEIQLSDFKDLNYWNPTQLKLASASQHWIYNAHLHERNRAFGNNTAQIFKLYCVSQWVNNYLINTGNSRRASMSASSIIQLNKLVKRDEKHLLYWDYNLPLPSKHYSSCLEMLVFLLLNWNIRSVYCKSPGAVTWTELRHCLICVSISRLVYSVLALIGWLATRKTVTFCVSVIWHSRWAVHFRFHLLLDWCKVLGHLGSLLQDVRFGKNYSIFLFNFNIFLVQDPMHMTEAKRCPI